MKIAPSLLSADFGRIADDIAVVERAGADQLHLDVMDGRFVPNITWGPKIVADLRKLTALPFDAHLMIEEPERYVEDFRKAGCDSITFHYEATRHVSRVCAQIRALGAKVGVAINPATPVGLLEDVVEDIDVVLVMSVNPGFGGQAFLPVAVRKVRQVRALVEARNPGCEVEIDGGIGRRNVAEVVAAGCDTCVMGASIFGAADPGAELRALRALAEPGALA